MCCYTAGFSCYEAGFYLKRWAFAMYEAGICSYKARVACYETGFIWAAFCVGGTFIMAGSLLGRDDMSAGLCYEAGVY